MADDITLTVRVRDMTRGEFGRLQQRLQGMDRDMRRLGGSSAQTTERARRLSQSVQDVSQQMSQLHRTGSLARSDMDHMRRTMGLLSRDLRSAGRAGDITGDQFSSLTRQLEETRLAFDYLDRDVRRHDAVAQRATRDAAAAQRAAQTIGRLQAAALREDRQRDAARQRAMQAMGRLQAAALREEERRIAARQSAAQAMGRLQAAALREEASRNAAAQRDELRRQMAYGQQRIAQARRISRAHSAALREEAQRQAAAQRAAAQAQQRGIGRLAGLGGEDRGLTLRFRALGEDDMNRMTQGFARLQRSMTGITGSTAQSRRAVRALNGDLRTMAQALRDATDSGSLSRREFNALSNGLQMTMRDARQLVRTGDLTRSSFVDMHREVARLRAQLRLLGREDSVFQRLGDRAVLLRGRLRDTSHHAGIVRRSLSRMGEGALGGMRMLAQSLGQVTSAFGKFRDFVSNSSRGMKVFLAVLAMLGPLAPVIGALLTTVLGGAFVALGAFALRSEKDVKGAFDRMKSSIGSTFRDAAQPMKAGLIVAMGEVEDAVQSMQGALTEAFSAAAPLVSDLAGAFTDLASGALPGVVASLQEMGPVMEGFRDAMAETGEGIGQMFAAMTADGGAEGLRSTWEVVGKGIHDVLVNIGQFTNAMSQSATATALLSTAFNVLSGILIIIEGLFAAIDLVLGPLIEKMSDLGLTAGLLGLIAGALESIGVSSTKTDTTTRVLKKTLLGEAAAHGEAAVQALKQANALKQLSEQIRKSNEENLNRFDAQAAMEKAIDDAATKAEELTGKVRIQNGVLEMNNEAGRQAYEITSAIARSTSEYIDKLREANAPQEEINQAWKRGRDQLIGLHDELGVSKAELTEYADTILKTPESVTTQLKAEKEAAEAKVEKFRKKVNEVDGKKAKVTASLELFRAMERLSALESQLEALDGKTARTWVYNEVRTNYTVTKSISGGKSLHEMVGATGGMFTGTGFTKRGFAHGGPVSGPGTGTSDDIFAPWLSNGEFVVNARQTKKFLPLLDALNKDKLKLGATFASGGKVSQATKDARREMSGSFGISYFGRLAGYKNNAFEKGLAKPDSLSALVSTLNQTMSLIKKAFSGSQEKHLSDRLKSAGKSLINYEKKLTKVNTSLDKAKDGLNDLKQSAKALKESVTSGVKSATSVVGAATSSDRMASIADVMTRMRTGVDKSSAFAKALKDLQARGVSKTIIGQIAEAGIEGGGLETAGAILSGSDADITRINEMQKQIDSAAAAAGKTASSAMFDAGIKAAEGLVKGLTKQQKAIEKAMMNIAKSMEKAIKKALGIKSPSRVMQEVGHHTAEGFAIGIQKNRNVDTAWTSMLNTNASSRASSSSGNPQVIQLVIGNKVFDEIVLDSSRRSVRTHGGNVQAVLGRRTN